MRPHELLEKIEAYAKTLVPEGELGVLILVLELLEDKSAAEVAFSSNMSEDLARSALTQIAEMPTLSNDHEWN